MNSNAEGPGSDDDYKLAPADPGSLNAWDEAIARQLEEDEQRGKFKPVEVVEEPLRFSVRDTMILVTFAAVVFGTSRFIRPDVFALVLGVFAFLSLVVLTIFKPQKSILHIGWWVVLLVYLTSALAAIVRG